MNILKSVPAFGLVSVAAMVAGGLAVRHFTQLAVAPLPVSSQLACKSLQQARGQARWDAPGQGGYLYGTGALLLQQCARGTWALRVKATPMNGEAPRLLVTRGGNQILDQNMAGVGPVLVPVEAGQPVVLVAPNTRIVLEDRNLYIRQFRFTPDVPCLQNPATFSSGDVGSASYGQFDLLSNGSVLLTACGQGQVSLRLSGSEEAGIGPTARVQVGGQTRFFGVIPAARPTDLKVRLEKGQMLSITFSNDAARQVDQRLIEVESAVFTSAP